MYRAGPRRYRYRQKLSPEKRPLPLPAQSKLFINTNRQLLVSDAAPFANPLLPASHVTHLAIPSHGAQKDRHQPRFPAERQAGRLHHVRGHGSWWASRGGSAAADPQRRCFLLSNEHCTPKAASCLVVRPFWSAGSAPLILTSSPLLASPQKRSQKVYVQLQSSPLAIGHRRQQRLRRPHSSGAGCCGGWRRHWG